MERAGGCRPESIVALTGSGYQNRSAAETSWTKPMREKNCGYRATRFSMPGMPMSTMPNPFSSKIERSCSKLFIARRSASSTTIKVVGSGIVACLTNWHTSDHGIWHSRREVGTMMADSGRLCSGNRAFQASEHSIGSWQVPRLQSGGPHNSNRSAPNN